MISKIFDKFWAFFETDIELFKFVQKSGKKRKKCSWQNALFGTFSASVCNFFFRADIELFKFFILSGKKSDIFFESKKRRFFDVFLATSPGKAWKNIAIFALIFAIFGVFARKYDKV